MIVAYVLEHLKGRHPVDLARAVTTAGFAVADPALDGVFVKQHRNGTPDRLPIGTPF